MKQAKRLLSLLLAALFILGVLPAPESAAAADTAVEVSDMETFRSLMTRDGDVSIRLTASLYEEHGHTRSEKSDIPMWAKVLFPWMMAIDHAVPKYYDPTGNVATTAVTQLGNGWYRNTPSYTLPYWCVVGSGRKVIDLNGFEIRVDYDNVYEDVSTMFLIPAGAGVVINDSRADSGHIFYDGYIFDVEDYPVDILVNDEGEHANIYYFATDMRRNIFEVRGGSLTVNGGTIEAGRSKNQWITNAHFMEGFSLNQTSTYTGNVSKYVTGTAVILHSGEVKINGGVLYGRGKNNAVITATGGKLTILEAVLDARGGANCLRHNDEVDLSIWSGRFCVNCNDVVYLGREGGIEGYPYAVEYGSVGALGFDGEDVDAPNRRICFRDPLPPRHWLIPNSIVKGDPFELWNSCVYGGHHSYMMIEPLGGGRADVDFDIEGMNDPWQPTIRIGDPIWVTTEYTPVYGEAAAARGTAVNVTYYYDVYEFESMTLLGSYAAAADTLTDLTAAIPGLVAMLEEGVTYIVFSTVIENYTGSMPYELRTVACNLFNATNSEPITVTAQPRSQIAAKKGASVTLTATGENATEAYWEMTAPYYRKLESTTFANGTATLSVPVTGDGTYRCVFANAAYSAQSAAADVSYMPSFELPPGSVRVHNAVIGRNTDIILYQDGDEDVYGWAGLYGWFRNGVHIDVAADPAHYEKAAYWGGGVGLKIKNVTAADAGRYVVRCTEYADTPFESGVVELRVWDPAEPITRLYLTGLGKLHIGDPAPTKDMLRTNDPRVTVNSIAWTGNDGGLITARSKYVINVSLIEGAEFDEDMLWSMDGGPEYAAVIDNDLGAAYLEDPAWYHPALLPDEEEDRLLLARTDFTLVRGSYVPLTGQLTGYEIVCPEKHAAEGHTHVSGGYRVLNPAQIPEGLQFTPTGFRGDLTAEPGEYMVTLRYALVDSVTGEKHNDWDVTVLITVLPAQGPGSEPFVHYHEYENWYSGGPGGTHYAYCEVCGDDGLVYEPHSWDDGEVVQTPTMNADGIIRYTCEVCNQTREEALLYEDYMPPFPEVKDVAASGDSVTVLLREYSGGAPGVLLFAAAYDASGKCTAAAVAPPDKSGSVTVPLSRSGAATLRVFVLDAATLRPLTSVFTKPL